MGIPQLITRKTRPRPTSTVEQVFGILGLLRRVLRVLLGTPIVLLRVLKELVTVFTILLTIRLRVSRILRRVPEPMLRVQLIVLFGELFVTLRVMRELLIMIKVLV